MGLTIHYTVEFKGTAKQLQTKLEKIRQACRDLPFEKVGEKIETAQITKETIKIWDWLQNMLSYPQNSQNSLAMRDLIMKELGVTTWRMIELGEWREEGNRSWKVQKPTTMVSLYLWPGEGCESAELNFQRIRGKFICRSFCKTQYAEEFVKCHLLVVQLLDMLKAEGFDVDVYDEGEYWETRDLKVLGKNINESTAMIAGLFGNLKSAAKEQGMVATSPIEGCKNIMRVEGD
jgi:hypothetical protein